MKKSALAAGLKAAASSQQATAPSSAPAIRATGSKSALGTVLIGAHYSPEVRRALKLVEAESGKKLKPLLGEAINDLCAKYGKPQPYGGED
jgi:hypothetical protein